MHLRKLTFTAGLFGALCSTWAYGLGLGEITLNSALNQPLDAEIKLLQVRNLTEEEIIVELAKNEDFQRFGVDRLFFLQNLRFDVQLDNPKGPLVKVTTDEPVREPYLIFLLEAQSPNGGRLLREYTLLMDLPVFANDSAQPVQGAQSGAQQAQAPAPAQAPRAASQSQQAAPARQGEPSRAPAAPQRSVAAQQPGVDVYGPVQPNDTLWEIAARVRPSQAVSMQQTMLALQRANPEAFINGNINLLKSGQVLRIPAESEFQALDRQTAAREVAAQNNQWSAGRDGQASGAELAASSGRPSTAPREEGMRGQLTLAAPGSSDTAGSRSGAGDDSARTEALENDLAITAEQLDASRRENEELSARVAELEAQIETMERLIEVSSEELRSMQLAAEQRQAQEGSAPSEAGNAQAEETTAQAEASTPVSEAGAEAPQAEVAAEESQPEAASEPAPVASAQQTAPEKVVQVSRPAQSRSWLDLLMDNLLYLLSALAAILVGAALWQRRRRQAEEEAESYAAVEDDIFADLDEGDAPAETEVLNEAANFEESFDFGADLGAGEEEAAEAEEPVEAETGDAVAEADIYIAYGKYDQAEDMLKKAILNEPNNTDARLKLLEVYAETKDVAKFDREYGQVMSLGNADATARAAELRGTIPDAGQFGDDEGDDFQFDLGDVSAPAREASDSDSELGELSLDGNWDAPEATAEQSEEDDFAGLSLDLDDAEDDPLSLDLDEAEDEDALSLDLGEGEDDDALSLDLNEAEEDDGLSLDLGEQSAEADEDISFDFDLELDAEDDSKAPLEGAAEDELASFELDDLADPEDKPQAKEEQGLEFSLDLDGGATELSQEDGLDKEASSEADFDLELDLDLELEQDAEDGEGSSELGLSFDSLDSKAESDELNLDLEIDTELAAADSEQADDEDDIFADLEFSPAAEAESSASDELSLDDDFELSFEEDGPKAAAPVSKEADEDDGFNLDMADLDLEALDQEMDALVGDVDGMDDLDIAPPADVPALSERSSAKPAAAGSEFDLDDDDLLTLEDEDEELAPAMSAKAAEPSFDFESAFGEDQEADEELDGEMDFLADSDEVATKLDLARAYIDMGDQDGARDILDEVANEGTAEQKQEAAELLEKIV